MTPHHRRRYADPPVGHGKHFWKNDWRWWLWHGERIWQDVIPLFCLVFLLLAYVNYGKTLDRIKTEGAERRDQNCLVFERDALAAVDAFHQSQARLSDTLDYLARLPRSERKSFLNLAIKAGVPRQRADVRQAWDKAKAAAAPPYCDLPGVGLIEPNPTLPPRPR